MDTFRAPKLSKLMETLDITLRNALSATQLQSHEIRLNNTQKNPVLPLKKRTDPSRRPVC